MNGFIWGQAQHKFLLFLAGFVVFCILLSLFVQTPVRASVSEEQAGQPSLENVFASLSGFQPGAVVSYKVYDPQSGRIVTGRAQTDSLGNLTLPMPEQFRDVQGNVTYNFLIDEDRQTLNVAVSHNPQTGDLSLEGSGAKQFAKITVESADGTFETRSDWAGLFEEKDIGPILSKDTPSYKIAFFSTNPAENVSALTRSPIIEIQTANGGGGPTSAGVNQFQPGNCSTPIISFCNVGRMNQQIQNIIDNLVTPLQDMARQLTFNAFYQVFAIGPFFDAKEQLEAQRDMQALKAEAHKDYHPSEEICRFGSYIRSLAHTEQKVAHDTLVLNKVLMDYYLNKKNNASSFGDTDNAAIRLKQFREVYCDPSDNNGGLDFLCEHDQDNNTGNSTHRSNPPSGIGAPSAGIQRMNKDIDFQRTFDRFYTLDIDFTDNTRTDDEEDVIALAKNLYWPSVSRFKTEKSVSPDKNHYMNFRRLVAINALAHNSFAHQVAMRAKAPPAPTGAGAGGGGGGGGGANAVTPGWAYMKTMMREFGLSDVDIEALIGEEPSYYAQMDVLTKKIYQSPHFYTNLYDKPANVDRILAVLDTISMMQQRDYYKTMLRHEMLASGLVQTDLTPTIEHLQAKFDTPKN